MRCLIWYKLIYPYASWLIHSPMIALSPGSNPWEYRQIQHVDIHELVDITNMIFLYDNAVFRDWRAMRTTYRISLSTEILIGQQGFLSIQLSAMYLDNGLGHEWECGIFNPFRHIDSSIYPSHPKSKYSGRFKSIKFLMIHLAPSLLDYQQICLFF